MKFLCFLFLVLIPCTSGDNLAFDLLDKFLIEVRKNMEEPLFSTHFPGKWSFNLPQSQTIDLQPKMVLDMFAGLPSTAKARDVFDNKTMIRELVDDDHDYLQVTTWLLNKEANFKFTFNWIEGFEVIALDVYSKNATFPVV